MINEIKTCMNKQYQIDCHAVETLKDSVFKIDTTSNCYIFKQKQSIDTINTEVDLYALLHQHGIKVNTHIKTVHDTYYVIIQEHPYVLMTYIEGEVIEDLLDQPNYLDLISNYGKELGKLHQVLSTCEGLIDYRKTEPYEEVFTWCLTALKEHNQLRYVGYLFDYIKGHKSLYDALPKQLIHRDFHPNNVLVQSNEITGFIDFDISVYSVRLFDIAYFLTAILSGCFDNEKKRSQWSTLLRPYLKGYELQNELTDAEKSAIKLMMLIIQITFVAYFLDHGYQELALKNIDIAKWIYKLPLEGESYE